MENFRTLRIAEIEARANYDPALHDTFFENFNWRHLDNSEMALCPPFVVFSEPGENFGEYLADLLRLVTAGKPLKVVMLRGRLDNVVTETGRAAALKSATDVELLFVSLRNLHFSQGSLAGEKPLKEVIAGGLESPRPGIFSIFSPNQKPKEREGRARQALFARAFPNFVYDPDKAADFVSCLDLSDNPAPEEAWPAVELEYLNEAGEPEKLERPLTFADFAAGEKALREHFAPLALNGDAEAALPLAEYLALTPERRRDKTPFIYSVDEKKHLVQLVPSQSIVAQTADKMHLWHTLQELAGIKNPYVQAAEQRTAERLAAEKETSLSEQKAQLEAQMDARGKEAVAVAMKTLAMRLTGLAPFPPAGQEAPAAALVAGPAAPGAEPAAAEVAGPPPPLAEEPAGEVSAEPWIEPPLCTTCDECTTLNKKIFVYNADKKAVFKDPRGGPYRDIVKAAEKCSSGAIHPGLPWDPNEKDTEKWIKRAEPFQ